MGAAVILTSLNWFGCGLRAARYGGSRTVSQRWTERRRRGAEWLAILDAEAVFSLR